MRQFSAQRINNVRYHRLSVERELPTKTEYHCSTYLLNELHCSKKEIW